MLKEVSAMTDAIRVTEEFLGEGKGFWILWLTNQSKCIGKKYYSWGGF